MSANLFGDIKGSYDTMALTKCQECGTDVSTEAKTCPKCGAPPPKKTSLFTWIIGGVIAFGFWTYLSTPKAPPAPPKTQEQLARERKTEAEFQLVVAVAKKVKSNTKNPASFKLTYAGLTDAGAVCLKFQATNSFNALVSTNYTVAKSVAGDSVELWNRHCAGKPITDYTHARQAV